MILISGPFYHLVIVMTDELGYLEIPTRSTTWDVNNAMIILNIIYQYLLKHYFSNLI
jgi:hypothetical protein